MEFGAQIGRVRFFISSSESLLFSDNIEIFACSMKKSEADACYEISYGNGKRPLEGRVVFQNSECEVRLTEKGYIYSFHVCTPLDPYKVHLYMEGKNHRIILPSEHRERMEKGIPISKSLGVERVFADHNQIVMHASVVDYEGCGILFCGNSGSGKSTQAELWKYYKGADILNGDRAVVHIGSELRAYGSPFAGSSGIIKNGNTSVKAIVVLEQARENELVLLKGMECLKRVFPRFVQVPWDEHAYDRGLNMIREMISMVPIYLLRCRPDREAVELVCQAVHQDI